MGRRGQQLKWFVFLTLLFFGLRAIAPAISRRIPLGPEGLLLLLVFAYLGLRWLERNWSTTSPERAMLTLMRSIAGLMILGALLTLAFLGGLFIYSLAADVASLFSVQRGVLPGASAVIVAATMASVGFGWILMRMWRLSRRTTGPIWRRVEVTAIPTRALPPGQTPGETVPSFPPPIPPPLRPRSPVNPPSPPRRRILLP